MKRAALALTLATATAGCHHKASRTECDALIARYAELYVAEHSPALEGEEAVRARAKERTEARTDDAFKNCASEVSLKELDCAMHAPTAAALTRCLE